MSPVAVKGIVRLFSSATLLCVSGCSSCAEPEKPNDGPSTPAIVSFEPRPRRMESDASPSSGGLAFGWKRPCKVPVVETVEKGGNKVEMTFNLTARDGEAGKVEVRWEDMRFLRLNDQPLTDEQRQALGPVFALTSMLPTLIVTPAGRFVEARGMEELLQRVMSSPLMGKEAERQKLAEALRTPQMRATMSEAVGEYWNTWVGMWVGIDWLAPGESKDTVTAIPMGRGKAPGRVHIEWVPGDSSSRATLKATTSVGGPEALRALGNLVAQSGLTEKDLAEAGVVDIEKTSQVEAEIDVATLRPFRTRYEKATVITAGAEKRASGETREDRFDWDRAEGCK